jgi:hypothetical protein
VKQALALGEHQEGKEKCALEESTLLDYEACSLDPRGESTFGVPAEVPVHHVVVTPKSHEGGDREEEYAPWPQNPTDLAEGTVIIFYVLEVVEHDDTIDGF